MPDPVELGGVLTVTVHGHSRGHDPEDTTVYHAEMVSVGQAGELHIQGIGPRRSILAPGTWLAASIDASQ